MNIIILDTNIVFSSILDQSSRIGDILFHPQEKLNFFAPSFLREEISTHRNKIIELAQAPPAVVDETIFQVYKRINFINDQQIPFDYWAKAVRLVRDVDMDDLPFVALSMYMDGAIWTGDLKLINGLRSKGFTNCYSTEDILGIINA